MSGADDPAYMYVRNQDGQPINVGTPPAGLAEALQVGEVYTKAERAIMALLRERDAARAELASIRAGIRDLLQDDADDVVILGADTCRRLRALAATPENREAK